MHLFGRRPGSANTGRSCGVCENGWQILRAIFGLEERVAETGSSALGAIRPGIIHGLLRLTGRRSTRVLRVAILVMEEFSFSLMRKVLENDPECTVIWADEMPKGLRAESPGSERENLVTAGSA